MFDPYRKWLGIPAGQRPPTHYQLLGISPDEHDPDVIKAAVVRQSAYVRNFQTGKYGAEATRLLNEIGEARVCLLDPTRRARYDSELRARQPATAGSPPATAPASRVPNSSQAPAGLYGPDLAGSRLPGTGVSSSSSRSLPMSPHRPPAASAPSAIVPVAPPARPAAHAPPTLAHDPVWRALEREAGPGHTSPPRTLLPSGRSSAPLPVWLWSLPLIAAGVLAITLVVHVTAPPPARQVAKTARGASGPAAMAEARTAAPPSPAPAFSQGSSAGSLRPNRSANPGEFSPPNVGGAPANPRAGASPLGGDARGAAFGAGGSTETTPSASTNPTAPSTSAPRYGLRPNGSRVPRGSSGTAERAGAANVYRPPPAARPAWDGNSTFTIPLTEAGRPPVYAPAHGPFVALGPHVYSLIDGALVGDTADETRPQSLQALSADGKYWASGDGNGVNVCRTDNGEVVSQLGGKHAGVQLLFLAFGGTERLFTVTHNRGAHYFQSWDLESRKLRKDIQLEDFGRQTTLSDDGRFLATHIISSGVVVYDVQKSPSKGRAKVAARIDLGESNNGGFLLVDGLQFSRDGKELVALYDLGERLAGWTPSGQIVFDYSQGFFHNWTWTFNEAAVECEPTGRGWLLWDRLFVDRKERRVTWVLDDESPHAGHDSHNRFIDADRLAVCLGSRGSHELVDVTIPWKKIEDSLAAREQRDAPVWMGPHQPVSLKIELGQTLGDLSIQEIERDVSGLLIDRLEADGINVLPGQPAVLAIQYAEQSSTAQTIMVPRPQGGNVARQVRDGTYASGVLELYIDGSPRPFWASRFSVEAKAVEGASVRSSLYAALRTRFARLAMPYFVSKDEDVLVSLPVIIRP